MTTGRRHLESVLKIADARTSTTNVREPDAILRLITDSKTLLERPRRGSEEVTTPAVGLALHGVLWILRIVEGRAASSSRRVSRLQRGLRRAVGRWGAPGPAWARPASDHDGHVCRRRADRAEVVEAGLEVARTRAVILEPGEASAARHLVTEIEAVAECGC